MDQFVHGKPEDALAQFQRAADLAPNWAQPWGYVAMLLELSRINEEPQAADLLVARARAAADRALELDPRNGAALTARALAMPIYGDWLNAEIAYREALEAEPDQIIARDHLARLLEQVGRLREALELPRPYAETFDQMAGYQFRKVVKLWSLDRLDEAEQVMDRAMRLWPRVYTIWFSRYWLYVRSGRPQLALDMSARLPRPEEIPAWNFELNDLNARAVLTRAPADVERAIAANREAAPRGAGFCENAIHLASQVGQLDEAFALAEAYYFGRGFQVGSSRFLIPHRTYTPTYRRLTGFLFNPSCAPMRRDPRFTQLTEETGLAAYWRRSGTRPDVLA
jgi:tetratricopeptide (TPR) repeat protein